MTAPTGFSLKARSPIFSSDRFEATQFAFETISELIAAPYGTAKLMTTVSSPLGTTDLTGQVGRQVQSDLRTRLMCQATVSASNGAPSVNFTPLRRKICTDFASGAYL